MPSPLRMHGEGVSPSLSPVHSPGYRGQIGELDAKRPGKFQDEMGLRLLQADFIPGESITDEPPRTGVEKLPDPRDNRMEDTDIGALDQNKDKNRTAVSDEQGVSSAVVDYIAIEEMGTMADWFKSDDEASDDGDEDEEELSDDKQKMLATADANRISVIFAISQLAEDRMQARLTRDLLLYIPFLIMFLFYFYVGRETESAFYIAEGYENLLLGNEFPADNPYIAYEKSGYQWPPNAAGVAAARQQGPIWDKVFGDLDAAIDWHEWFEGVAMTYLWGRTNQYRTDQNLATVAPLGTGSNFLIGSFRVRVYRMPNNSCTAESSHVPAFEDTDYMSPDAQDNFRCANTAGTLLKSAALTNDAHWPGVSAASTEHDCRLACNRRAECTASVWRTQAPLTCEVFNETCVGQSITPNVTGRVEYRLRRRVDTRAVYPRTGVCYSEFDEDAATNDVPSAIGPVDDPQRFKMYVCPEIIGRSIPGKVKDTVYPCGGYIYDIPFNISYNDAMVEAFKLRGDPNYTLHPGAPRAGILDDGESTRFIVGEFFSYTGSLNYFTAVKLYTEVSAGGSWIPSFQMRNFKLWTAPNDVGKTVYDAFFMLVVFIFLGKFFVEWSEFAGDTKNLGKGGLPALAFICQPWNLLEFVNLLIFIVVFGFRIAWYTRSSQISFSVPAFEFFNELDYIMWIFMSSLYINSINTIFCFLKILKYVQLNDRFNILSRTVESSVQNLIGILVIFIIIIFAYSVTGNTLFGNGVEEYRSMSVSMSTNLRLLLGDFDYEELREENLVMAGIFFWTFVVLGLFLLLNFIIAVISDAFDAEMRSTRAPPIDEQAERAWKRLVAYCKEWMHPIRKFRETFLTPDEELLTSEVVRRLAEHWLVEEVGKVSGRLFPERPTGATIDDTEAAAEEFDRRMRWGDNEFGYLNARLGEDSALREKYSINYRELKREIVEKLWLGPQNYRDAVFIESQERLVSPEPTEQGRKRMFLDDLYSRTPDPRFMCDAAKGKDLDHKLGEMARGLGPRPVAIDGADGQTHLLKVDYGHAPLPMDYQREPPKGKLHYYANDDQEDPIIVDGRVLWNDTKDAKCLVLLGRAEDVVGRVPFPADACRMRELIPVLRRVLNLCVGPLGADIGFSSTNNQLCHAKTDAAGRALLTPDLDHAYQRLTDRDEKLLRSIWWDLTLEKQLRGDEADGDDLQKERQRLKLSAFKSMQAAMGQPTQKEFHMKELFEDLAAPDDREAERKRMQRAEEEHVQQQKHQKMTSDLLNLLRPSQRTSESVGAISSRIEKAQGTLGNVCDLMLHLDSWLTDIYKTFHRPLQHGDQAPRVARAVRPRAPDMLATLEFLLNHAADGCVPYCVPKLHEPGGVAMSDLLDLEQVTRGDALRDGDEVDVICFVRPQRVLIIGQDAAEACPVWCRVVRRRGGGLRGRALSATSDDPFMSKSPKAGAGSPWGAPASARRFSSASDTFPVGDTRRMSTDSIGTGSPGGRMELYVDPRFLTGLDGAAMRGTLYRIPEHREKLPPSGWEGRYMGR